MASAVRLALRGIARHKTSSLVLVAILALGSTANTGFFAMVDSVLLRRLPFSQPEELHRIYAHNADGATGMPIFPPAFFALEESNGGFSGLAAIVAGRDLVFRVRPDRGGGPFEVAGAVVSARLFELLGAEPTLGRLFRPEEDERGDDRVVLLSGRLWRSRFAADPAILGRTLHLNDRPFTVVGVLADGFELPAEVELWIPNPSRAPEVRNLGMPIHAYFEVVGRLRKDVSREAAERELDAIYRQVIASYPEVEAGEMLEIVSLQEDLRRGAKKPLGILQSAAAAVFLLACVNVAGLLLIRSLGRGREMALRAVLGAPRGLLVRQLTVEHLVLFTAGGIVGLAGAWWTVRILVAGAPVPWLRYHDVALHPTTVLVSCAAMLGAGAIFGCSPAILAVRSSVLRLVQEEAHGGARRRLAAAVVVVQISLAVALLVTAGLLTRSFLALQAQRLGFEPHGLTVVQATLLESRYPTQELRNGFLERVRGELRSVPGVSAVGGSQFFFLTDGSYWNTVTAASDGAVLPRGGRAVAAAYVMPGYFSALGLLIRQGRGLPTEPGVGGAHEVVVSHSFAARSWPDGIAVGRRIEFEARWWTIVGVCDDLRRPSAAAERGPDLFLPYEQALMSTGQMTFLIRAERDLPGLTQELDERVRRMDAAQTLAEPLSVAAVVDAARRPQRYTMKLVALFAGCAVTIAAVGIYALLSYRVMTRRRELGIRMALGADRRRVGWTVTAEVLALGTLGLLAGGGLAALLGQALHSLLFGISPWDGASWLVATAAGGAMTAAAAWLPVRRAIRLDPWEIIRQC